MLAEWLSFSGWTTMSDGWSWFLESVVRTWWFDPLSASLSFAVFVNWYWYHERRQGVGMVNAWTPWDRSSLLAILPTAILPETIGKTTAAGSNTAATTAFQKTHQRSDTPPLEDSPLAQSLAAYWAGVWLWTTLVPPAAPSIPDGPLPRTVLECSVLMAQVLLGIVLYDALFFVVHWILHAHPRLVRHVHARHHHHHHGGGSGGTLQASDTLRHGLVDGALQVLVNIVVQRHTVGLLCVVPQEDGASFVGVTVMAKSRLARWLHNVLVPWMLVESHAAATTPYVWRRWCVGVREHREHHGAAVSSSSQPRSRRTRYQQFFGYLDELRWKWCCGYDTSPCGTKA